MEGTSVAAWISAVAGVLALFIMAIQVAGSQRANHTGSFFVLFPQSRRKYDSMLGWCVRFCGIAQIALVIFCFWAVYFGGSLGYSESQALLFIVEGIMLVFTLMASFVSDLGAFRDIKIFDKWLSNKSLMHFIRVPVFISLFFAAGLTILIKQFTPFLSNADHSLILMASTLSVSMASLFYSKRYIQLRSYYRVSNIEVLVGPNKRRYKEIDTYRFHADEVIMICKFKDELKQVMISKSGGYIIEQTIDIHCSLKRYLKLRSKKKPKESASKDESCNNGCDG